MRAGLWLAGSDSVSGEWAPLPHEASALQVLSPDLTWDRQQSLSSQSAGDTQALVGCFWITPGLTCAGVKPARTVPCSPEALRVLSDVQLAKYQSVIIKLYDLITVCEDRVGNQLAQQRYSRQKAQSVFSLKCHSAQVKNAGNIICDKYIPELDLQKRNYFMHRLGWLWWICSFLHYQFTEDRSHLFMKIIINKQWDKT